MSINRPTKLGLLEKYADKPVKGFVQVDGFLGCGTRDYALRGDADGDAIMTGPTQELMSTCPPVRVLIPAESMPERQQVARLLRKIADMVEKSDCVTTTTARDALPSPVPGEDLTFAIVPLTAKERRDVEHHAFKYLLEDHYDVDDVKEALTRVERATLGELLKPADLRPTIPDDEIPL